jgi:hypothetical protein
MRARVAHAHISIAERRLKQITQHTQLLQSTDARPEDCRAAVWNAAIDFAASVACAYEFIAQYRLKAQELWGSSSVSPS